MDDGLLVHLCMLSGFKAIGYQDLQLKKTP